MTTLLQSFAGVTESRAATAETAQNAVEQVIVEAPFVGELTVTIENREHCCKDQVADKPQGASCKIDIKFFVATNLLNGQRACQTTKIFGDPVTIARLATPLFRPPIL
ncbi:MAG: hypothetical protein AAGE61_20275 [Pseudomonadota bacterium]